MIASHPLIAQVEKQSLELWFDRPAGIWEEALPLGNGRSGAMVFGGIEKEHYSLNDHHLWSGGPVPGNEGSPEILEQVRQAVFESDYGKADQLWRGMHGPYSARYLPIGDLFLEFSSDQGNSDNYKRSLDLRNAISTATYENNGVIYKRVKFDLGPGLDLPTSKRLIKYHEGNNDHELTSSDAEPLSAMCFNMNPLQQQPDPVPWINNSEETLVEINCVTGALNDFPAIAGKTYHFKKIIF